jgi:hypothetical protein
MKREQKRYATEQVILDAMEAAKHRAAALEKKALELDGERLMARNNAAKADADGTIDGEFWRDQMQEFALKADALRRAANSLKDTKVRNLGEKLAALRTEVMPFMGGDNSVV